MNTASLMHCFSLLESNVQTDVTSLSCHVMTDSSSLVLSEEHNEKLFECELFIGIELELTTIIFLALKMLLFSHIWNKST